MFDGLLQMFTLRAVLTSSPQSPLPQPVPTEQVQQLPIRAARREEDQALVVRDSMLLDPYMPDLPQSQPSYRMSYKGSRMNSYHPKVAFDRRTPRCDYFQPRDAPRTLSRRECRNLG